jgi:hypothetical protein
MSRHRLDSKGLLSLREQRRRSQQSLRELQKTLGLVSQPQIQITNTTSSLKTVEEEQKAREAATVEQVRILRDQRPLLLSKFAKIEDPHESEENKAQAYVSTTLRRPDLRFSQDISPRIQQSNRTMTKPQFIENLRLMFPELESIPHHDTINRLLTDIEAVDIEAALWLYSEDSSGTRGSTSI